MNHSALMDVFIFLSAACLMVPLASRFKLGSVLGYLGTGIVIGPWCLGLVTDAESVMHFAEFGVVMMLFVIGLELEPAVLWRLRSAILGLGGLQVLLSTVAFTSIGMLLGFAWQPSLIAGMALSLSSTALVLQMLHERNMMNTIIGEICLSVLLFQDIAVIPFLAIIPLLATRTIGEPVTHGFIASFPAYVQTIIIAAVITLMILSGRYLSPNFFRVIAKTRIPEIFTAMTLAIIVGITLMMEALGVSPALGAFIAGVVLANSEYRHSLETDIAPFKGLLLGLFFISVGMGINFGLLAHEPFKVAAAVIVLMGLKLAILWMLGRQYGLSKLHSIGYAFALSQGGEFAFVLFQFAGSLAVLQADQVSFFVLVVALSILFTPLVMIAYRRFVMPRFMSELTEATYDVIDQQHPVILAGFGRFAQIIGRFLMGQGVKVTILEKDPDQIALLRKFGFKGYFGDATRMDMLKSAGIGKAKLFVLTVGDVAISLQIVKMIRAEYPDLTIFARARNRRHANQLNKLGVQYFKRELFDSSLDMAKAIMVWLGKPEQEVNTKAEQFRAHDEETLQESFAFYEDESALLSYSKKRNEELELILRSDSGE